MKRGAGQAAPTSRERSRLVERVGTGELGQGEVTACHLGMATSHDCLGWRWSSLWWSALGSSCFVVSQHDLLWNNPLPPGPRIWRLCAHVVGDSALLPDHQAQQLHYLLINALGHFY